MLSRLFTKYFFYLGFQQRDVFVYCIPKLVRLNLVITMDQNVPHAFYRFPFNFWMSFTEFLAEHIDGLADNLYVFDKAVIDNGVIHFLRSRILGTAVFDGIDSIQYMLKAFTVSNWLYHRQGFYRG